MIRPDIQPGEYEVSSHVWQLSLSRSLYALCDATQEGEKRLFTFIEIMWLS